MKPSQSMARATLLPVLACLPLAELVGAQVPLLPAVTIGLGHPSSSPSSRPALDIAMDDFNGDGALDFVYPFSLHVAMTVVLSDPQGGFQPRVELPYNFGPNSLGPNVVELMDFDGDAQIDILTSFQATALASAKLYWLRGRTDGSFEAPIEIFTHAGRLSTLKVADLDGNGRQNIVLVTEGGQEGWVLSQPGPGMNLQSTSLFTGGADGMRALDVGDLDGDGDLDIVYGANSITTVFAIENLGSGSFGPPVALSTTTPESSALALGDMDSDGDLDVVFGARIVIPMGQPFQMGTTITTPLAFFAGPSDISLGDVDRDGDLDILVASGILVRPVLWLNQGSLDFEHDGQVFPDLAPAFTARLADVNIDGAVDVLIAALNGVVFYPQVSRIVGEGFCDALNNSTDRPGRLVASGSDLVLANDLTLVGLGLPALSFGIGLASRFENAGFLPAGTSGRICVGTPAGGGIGRYDAPGEVFMASQGGVCEITLNLAATPTPNGRTPAMSGETLRFQLWHRDTMQGVATSNFTTAVRVRLL